MYQNKILPHFKKQLKKLTKKYGNLPNDTITILTNFNKQSSVFLGNSIYKIRIKSSDINKGKSKGFRLIIFIIELEKIIYPILIYYKGDKENVSKREIKYHLECTINEIEKSL